MYGKSLAPQNWPSGGILEAFGRLLTALGQWDGRLNRPQRTPGIPSHGPYSTQVLPGCRYWGRTPSLRGAGGPVYQSRGAGHMHNWVCACASGLLGPPCSCLPFPLLGLVESTATGPPTSWNIYQDSGIYTVLLAHFWLPKLHVVPALSSHNSVDVGSSLCCKPEMDNHLFCQHSPSYPGFLQRHYYCHNEPVNSYLSSTCS